jgi:hypothetical protein
MKFTRNVFVNCPFDPAYRALLRPLLFTLIYLGFKPRIALESFDSGEPRIDKIVQLVEESKFAIHDLSRCRAEKEGELYRLNMPFELGLDVGCRRFGTGKSKSKRCLILEAEPYRYQAAISDLAGSDIAAHHNEPRDLVAAVRGWLGAQMSEKFVGPTKLFDAFNEFMIFNYEDLVQKGYSKSDIDELSIRELVDCMSQWVSKGFTAA